MKTLLKKITTKKADANLLATKKCTKALANTAYENEVQSYRKIG